MPKFRIGDIVVYPYVLEEYRGSFAFGVIIGNTKEEYGRLMVSAFWFDDDKYEEYVGMVQKENVDSLVLYRKWKKEHAKI